MENSDGKNQVPKSTEIFGRTIEVVINDQEMDDKKLLGEARYHINKIFLAKIVDGDNLPEDEKMITFIHEVLHFILAFSGYEEIFKKKKIDIEQFIESMASGIYEALYKYPKY